MKPPRVGDRIRFKSAIGSFGIDGKEAVVKELKEHQKGSSFVRWLQNLSVCIEFIDDCTTTWCRIDECKRIRPKRPSRKRPR